MVNKSNLRIILVRPGSTDLDSQGRIKGSLDIPLNSNGALQARKTATELDDFEIDLIFTAPCLSAQQTAEQLSRDGAIRIKVQDELRNLDRGLWHGKSIEELKDSQPKVYRQWQEHPETVCPPGGETLERAQTRIDRAVRKIQRRYKSGTIAIVMPEPAASLLRSHLNNGNVGDLWKAECQCGGWESIDVAPDVIT